MRKLSLALSAAALSTAAAPAMAADLTVSVEIPRVSGASYHRPYVAVWIERPDNTAVRTMAVWYETSNVAEGKDWPASLSVMVLQKSQQGVKQAEKKATRWEKGDPSRLISGTDPVVVPVDPESTAAFTSQEIIRKLALGIRDLRVTLEGDASNPQDEKLGLQKVGEDLVNELHKVAQKR